MENPLAVVRRFVIPYGEKRDLFLEGRVTARTEEGLDEVNWFQGEIRYRNHKCEVGGQVDALYKEVKRGAITIEEVEDKIRAWCKWMGLEVSEVIVETTGVTV